MSFQSPPPTHDPLLSPTNQRSEGGKAKKTPLYPKFSAASHRVASDSPIPPLSPSQMGQLPNGSLAGYINNRPDNFTELWILPLGKLHKHPSEKQKSNLQTQLCLRMSRNPFPTQPAPSITIVPNTLSGPRKHIWFPSGLWASW